VICISDAVVQESVAFLSAGGASPSAASAAMRGSQANVVLHSRMVGEQQLSGLACAAGTVTASEIETPVTPTTADLRR